jgi:hypothetical protein
MKNSHNMGVKDSFYSWLIDQKFDDKTAKALVALANFVTYDDVMDQNIKDHWEKVGVIINGKPVLDTMELSMNAVSWIMLGLTFQGVFTRKINKNHEACFIENPKYKKLKID